MVDKNWYDKTYPHMVANISFYMDQDPTGSLMDTDVIPDTHSRLLPELDSAEDHQQDMLKESSASFKFLYRTARLNAQVEHILFGIRANCGT